MKFSQKTKVIALCALLAVAVPCIAGNQAIDPAQTIVKRSIGGENFDIPLGYFYHWAIWDNGRWPSPNRARLSMKSERLYAYIDGMRPWTPEVKGAFTSLASPDISMIIISEHPSEWLASFLSPRRATLRQVTVHDHAEGMRGFVSDYAKGEVLFLQPHPPEKPNLLISCVERPGGGCRVKFDYRANLRVQYSLQRGQLHKWKKIHADLLRTLDSFSKRN